MTMISEEELSTPVVFGAAPGGCGARAARALRRRVPALRWLRRYGPEAAAADAVAGVTLGLTLVPQGLAYAALADLPVQHGLYTSFVGTIMYVFLGTVKEVSIGPTSLMALLTLQACRGLPAACVPLLTLLSGAAVLLMGLMRLGFLMEFISPAVTSGFTSATALVIVASQLKGALGLSYQAGSAWADVRQAAGRWRLVRPADCALAAACCVVLLTLRKLGSVRVRNARVARALWLVSIARNALVVLAAASLAYWLHDPSQPPVFKLSGRVEAGLPRLWLPLQLGGANSTLGAPGGPGGPGVLDAARAMGGSLLLVPVVMVLANIAIAKAFSRDGRVDATQEMLALGLCNVCGALAGAMPACGAFTRSALAHCSGVRTCGAGLYAGIITLLAMIFLTEYFYFIPKACLSSVLICAVIFMVDLETPRRLWRTSRGSALVLLLTLGVGLGARVELGVPAGALASLALLLLRLARPEAPVSVVKTESGTVIRLEAPAVLVYFNVERATRRAVRAVLGAGGAELGAGGAEDPSEVDAVTRKPLLMDAGKIWLMGSGVTQVLERISKKLKEEGSMLVVYNASASCEQPLRHASLEQAALTARGVSAALAALREAAAHNAARGDAAPLLNKELA